MGLPKLYPCGRISRRRLMHQAAGGFLGIALGALWSQAGDPPDASPALGGRGAGPHFSPRAKSVIFLFMCGGVSHIDTFDPKDQKWTGTLIDAIGFGDNVAPIRR